MGDNGAGKTTLVKCIAGTHRPDSGRDPCRRPATPASLTAESARELGIETVHQNLSLVDTLDVMQNFFLNRELVGGGPVGRALGWLNKRAMYRDDAEKRWTRSDSGSTPTRPSPRSRVGSGK